jgi:outer membrane biosynthesis protein TonB
MASQTLKIAVYWGDILYDTVLCRPPARVTVGKKWGNTFLLDLPHTGCSVENLELLRFDRRRPVLAFDESISGVVRMPKGVLGLDAAIQEKKAKRGQDGLYRLTLNPDERAELSIGHVTFLVSRVEKTRRVRRASLWNPRSIALFGLFCLVMGPIVWLVNSYKPDTPMATKEPERLVQMLKIEKAKPPPPKPKPKPAEPAAGQRKTADGGAQKGPSGKATLKAPSAAESLRSANLSAITSSLTSLTATGALPKGDNTLKPGEAFAPIAQAGTGGFSTEGFKQGGGGKGVGIGRTEGQGEGGFGGTGKLGLAGGTVGSANAGRGVSGGGSDGGLDRDVVDTIVRQRKDRIRLCYERQLNFKPTLSGKLTVQFVIGKEGKVLQATLAEDTMRDDAVRNCLLAEVKTWTFPKPTGGAVVTVDYPFVFESGGR